MRSRAPLLIVIASLIIISLIVLFGVWRRYHQIRANLPTVIRTELRTLVNREVRIGSVGTRGTGTAVITDLAIANGDDFEDGILLSVPRATVRLNLVSLILGRASVASSIRSIMIERPDLLLVRDRTGRWNVEDILRRPPVTAARFEAVVRTRDGRVTVLDYSALLPRLPGRNAIESVSGSLDFRPESALTIRLSGNGTGGRFRRFSADGTWGTPAATRLNLDLAGASASYWLSYFTDIRAWDLYGGTFDGTATLTKTAAGRVRATGNAALRDSAFTSPALTTPIRPFAANIRFINTNLSLAGRGYLRNSPVTVTGRILGFTPAVLDLRVTSESMDLRTLQASIPAIPRTRQVRWSTPATISGTISGQSQDLLVRARLQTPRAVIYGAPVAALIAQGQYRNGVITVSSATARAANGTLRATASIDLEPFRITVNGDAADVNLRAVRIPGVPPLAGTADARFTIDYANQLRALTLNASVTNGRVSELSFTRGRANADLTGPRSGTITVSTGAGSLSGVPLRSSTARAVFRGNRISVQQAVVDLERGTVSAAGDVTTAGALDLSLIARDAPIATLVRPFGYRQLTGIADFNGRLTGTIARPRVAGQFTARDGRVRDVEYDLLTGRLIATREALILEDITLRRAGGELAAAGRIVIARGEVPQVDLRIRGRQLALQELLTLLQIRVRASGTVTTDLTVRGRFPAVQVTGFIELTDATVAGERIDYAIARVRFERGRTVFEELFARRDGMRVAAVGFIDLEGRLQVDVTGENLSLSLFNDVTYPYVALEGPMTFSGQVRGTVSRPTISGRLEASAPVVNNQPFEALAGDVSWDGTRLTFADTALLGQGARYLISLIRYNPSQQFVQFNGSITAETIQRAAGLFRNSPVLGLTQGETLRRYLATLPEPFTGAFDASVSLSGRIGNIGGQAAINASGVELGASTLTNAQLSLVAQRSVFALNRVSLTGPGINLSASAEFVDAQPTELAATIENTDADALSSLIRNAPILPAYDFGRRLQQFAGDLPQPVTGSVSASMRITDIMETPTGTIALAARDITAAGATVGTILADARLSNGSVLLDQLRWTPMTGEALLRGSIDPEGTVAVTGSFDQFPLEALQPWADVETLSGTLNAQISAIGTADNPTVQGAASVTDLRISGLAADTIIAESLSIAGDRISMPRVLISRGGAELIASGSLPFNWAPPFIPREGEISIQVQVADSDFSLAESFPDAVEESRGVLSANMTIRGTVENPSFAGTVSLQDGFLNLRNFQNDFADVTLSGRFDGSELVIDTFSGTSSMGGTFNANGSLQLTDLANIFQSPVTLFVNLDSLRLNMVNVTQTIDERLRFTVTGQLIATETLRSPLVQGQLAVRDALLSVPGDPLPTSVEIPPLPVNPQMAVTINLTQDVVVERGALRAEVLGPITITGTYQQPVVAGTVQITSGRLRYIGRTLELDPGGTASFLFRPPEPAVISVNVTARTRFTTISSFTRRATRYTIIVDISGPLGALDIDVRSSPPGLDQLQALGVIFGGAPLESLARGIPVEEILREQLGQILLGVAIPGLFEPLTLGPFTFAVETGLDVPLQLSATTALSDRLFLIYTRSLAGNIPIDTLAISYTISQQLALTVEFEGQNGPTQDTEFLVEYFTRF